ncbi:aminotransferase class I/II-fold pyridoxal phosphate-dependent enzyme [Streptoverticillium reticulum]|uniref:aminotransferase class I/II-fold pyridoxal phosphate-dependent enzyme n=1 Tax=Streptoverticillium reticulum TaxID=1433415 RepID=UPI0039BFB8C5
MQLSSWGTTMSRLSGIRSIMDDIAATAGRQSDGAWCNLSPGNPAHIPEVVDTWRRLAGEALREDFFAAGGQYGPSRGTNALVDAVVRYFDAAYGWGIGPENVVVGPGSQLLAYMAVNAFTGPTAGGERELVLPCVPDYTGYQGLSMAEGGTAGVEPVVVHEDERRFRYAVDLDAVRRRTSMGAMLVSSPGNPTGRCLDAAELDGLIAIAEERGVPLIVDHAYGQPFPRVVDAPLAPVFHPHVVNCFTFSKAGLPGERLGFAIGPAEVIDVLVSFTANAALHAPQLVQTAAARALDSGDIDVLAAKTINPYYRAKRLTAEELLHDRLPESVDWRLHSSDGGMFCWLWIDHPWFDDLDAYRELKNRQVFVVPGRHFFVPPLDTPFLAGHGRRCIRLSLSGEEDVIARGITCLGDVLTEQQRNAA